MIQYWVEMEAIAELFWPVAVILYTVNLLIMPYRNSYLYFCHPTVERFNNLTTA